MKASHIVVYLRKVWRAVVEPSCQSWDKGVMSSRNRSSLLRPTYSITGGEKWTSKHITLAPGPITFPLEGGLQAYLPLHLNLNRV